MDESSETAETVGTAEAAEAAGTAGDVAGRGEAVVPRPDQAAHDQSQRDRLGAGSVGGVGSAGSTESAGSAGWADPAGSPGAAGPGEPSEPASRSVLSEPSEPSEPFESSEQSEQSEQPGPRAPRKWWQWIYAPFAAVWRFAFPKKPRPFIVELPFLLAIALVLAFVIKTFLVQAFVIPSGSMQQTLEINDRVLVNRFSNWLGHEPNRGDIVVFQDPGNWLEAEPVKPKNVVSKTLTAIGLLPEDNGDLIKRVIGVGGDHVECKGNGAPVTVNGVPLKEDGYLYPSNLPAMESFSVDVPKDHLWVMGDHREVSVDSRAHIKSVTGGFVPVGNVVGIAVLKVWPPDHFGTLPVPSTFKQGFQALAAPGAVPVAAFALAVPITVVRRRRKLRQAEALSVLGL